MNLGGIESILSAKFAALLPSVDCRGKHREAPFIGVALANALTRLNTFWESLRATSSLDFGLNASIMADRTEFSLLRHFPPKRLHKKQQPWQFFKFPCLAGSTTQMWEQKTKRSQIDMKNDWNISWISNGKSLGKKFPSFCRERWFCWPRTKAKHDKGKSLQLADSCSDFLFPQLPPALTPFASWKINVESRLGALSKRNCQRKWMAKSSIKAVGAYLERKGRKRRQS
jgi:hypothetical protein